MYVLAVKDRSGWARHTVSEEVYIYVKQLEFYINNPEKSKLKELYPERFTKST